MATGLLIRIRFHDGRCHAMRGDGTPEWPPAPARLFQALVAAAAEGAALAEADRAALEWLERLPPPLILAPPGARLTRFGSFVPNNDLDAVTGIETVGGNPAGYIRDKDGWSPAASSIRTAKPVAPVAFDATAPVSYLWTPVQPCAEAARVLALAEGLHHLGRGVDPAWADAELTDAGLEPAPGLLLHQPGVAGAEGWAVPVPGTLASLTLRHAAFLRRFATSGKGRSSTTSFTNPPKPRVAQIRYDAPPHQVCFDLREGSGERFQAIPAAEAGVLVDRLIERAAARLGSTPAVERFLIGREAGPEDLARRVRVIALPTLRAQGDRAIRRVLVAVPPTCPLPAADVAWAFSGLSPLAEPHDPETGEVHALLVRAADLHMAATFARPSRLWQSETALALPNAPRRRLDPANPGDKAGAERGTEEAVAVRAVRTALRQAGVDVPAVAVRVQREPFAAQGTRAEAFAEGTRFGKHTLWHAELRFAAPVAGPLLLGNGRFRGLGLMVPVEEAPPAGFALAIRAGLAEADPLALASALRRAVMARAAGHFGPGGIPAWFTGHAADGSPLRPGTHAHLAFAADLPRSRLLVLPPHTVGHRPAGEDCAFLEILANLLDGLTELHAGTCGLVTLAAKALEADDPLLAPAREWESLTPCRPARHPKGREPEAELAADIRSELARRGLPDPASIKILSQASGPRGGLSFRAHLTFPVAIPGPVLLGRTLHGGGGLFDPAGSEGR